MNRKQTLFIGAFATLIVTLFAVSQVVEWSRSCPKGVGGKTVEWKETFEKFQSSGMKELSIVGFPTKHSLTFLKIDDSSWCAYEEFRENSPEMRNENFPRLRYYHFEPNGDLEIDLQNSKEEILLKLKISNDGTITDFAFNGNFDTKTGEIDYEPINSNLPIKGFGIGKKNVIKKSPDYDPDLYDRPINEVLRIIEGDMKKLASNI